MDGKSRTEQKANHRVTTIKAYEIRSYNGYVEGSKVSRLKSYEIRSYRKVSKS